MSSMKTQNLYEVFHAGEVDQSELEQLFSEHFKGAMHLSPDEIVYPGHETDHALRLRYDDGLREVAAGPKLVDSDVETLKERIEKEILASEGTRVGRVVLFTKVPVEGYFRHRDEFQILPVPPEAPRPEFSMGDHPFILEFRFAASSNWQIRHLRRAVLEREFELVMAGLFEFSTRGLGKTSRWHWVLGERDQAKKWRSDYRQEMYTYPGLSLEGEDFTATDGMQKLSAIHQNEYYTRLGIRAGQALELPANVGDLLDRFFALSKQDRDRFLRASFWFQHAGIVHSYSRSAAYTALISAIEALMAPERPEAYCETCRRPMGRGTTQRFADFVESLVPGSGVPEAERKKFYGIRSKLSHGGSLLHSDRRTWSPGLTPARVEEWMDATTTWKLVRIVLVNWLLSK